jgi:hypothetical protein
MNTQYVYKIAKKYTPHVGVNSKEWNRHDIVCELKSNDNIGIELGVAEGVFSSRMMKSGKFKRFYGVDIYGDRHDTREYISALRNVGLENPNYHLLRMDFDSALDLFPDEYFDFIYIDGFAHTGEEGGKTILDWYNKLKVGGVIAGDDYHQDWPLVVWAVNKFALQLNQAINITTLTEDVAYCHYPSWYLIKFDSAVKLTLDPVLVEIARKEKKRVHRNRSGGPQVRRLIIRMLEKLNLKEPIRRIFRR